MPMSLDLLAEAPSPGPGTYHVMAPQRDLLRPYLLSYLVVISTTLLLLTGSHQTIHAGIVLALLTCLCVCCAVSSSLTWPLCQHWPSTQQAACTATQASTKRGMHPSCRLRSSTTSHDRQVCSAAVCACGRHIPAVRLSDNPNLAPAVSPPSSLTH